MLAYKRHYLTVSLPEDHMLRPGENVTLVSFLQKLFKLRLSDKLASGFSVLFPGQSLSGTLNTLVFSRVNVHGNKYKFTYRVDTDEFVW